MVNKNINIENIGKHLKDASDSLVKALEEIEKDETVLDDIYTLDTDFREVVYGIMLLSQKFND